MALFAICILFVALLLRHFGCAIDEQQFWSETKIVAPICNAAREEFEYQNRRNARNEVHGLNLKDEYTSRKKKKKKHEEEEEEDEFVFQAEIECHWGNSRSDLKYLVERVR
ncbi:MAG: hypothetical protein ACO2YM_07705 [Schleiferiaceae bacterium]